MILTKEITCEILSELKDYSTLIAYLEENKVLEDAVLENVIYAKNTDQVAIFLPKLLSEIDPSFETQAFHLFAKKYSKQDCLELVLKENSYHHLEEIKDVALGQELLDELITEDIYRDYLNVMALDELLQKLEKSPKNKFISTKETFKRYYSILNDFRTDVIIRVKSHINEYYIRKFAD